MIVVCMCSVVIHIGHIVGRIHHVCRTVCWVQSFRRKALTPQVVIVASWP